MSFKRKIVSSCIAAGLILGVSVIPAQASSPAPNGTTSSIAQIVSPETVSSASSREINEYLTALTENLEKASAAGDSVATDGLKKLNSLPAAKKRDLAVAAITTDSMEASSNGVKVVKTSSAVQSVRTAAASTSTLRQPVACIKKTSALGVPLTQVRMSSAVWSKNYGKTLVRVEDPTARITYNYDPVMTVTFSGAKSWKSKNSGYFEVDVEGARKVGWAGSAKGSTLRLASSSYGVQKSCKWVD